MKPRKRERERERHHLGRDDDAISDGGECSTPPALRPPTDVICKVFSQLDCVDLLTCSLVCKQWYRGSSELREGWKSEYMEAAMFCSGIKRDVHPPSSTCSIKGLHSWQWYRDPSELREGWKSEYMEASALFCLGIKRDVHPPSSTCSIRGLHSWCP